MTKGSVVLVALLVACRDGNVALTPVSASLEDSTAWVGSEGVVSSSQFINADTIPVILVGGKPATVHYLGKGRVAVQLPDSVGSYDVSVELHNGAQGSSGTINVGGAFQSTSTTGTAISNAVPWPDRHGATIVAYPWPAGHGYPDGSLSLLTLESPDTSDHLPIPGSLASGTCQLYGPGLSVTGGLLLKDQSCYEARVWNADAYGNFTVTDSAPIGTALNAYLGGGNWLYHASTSLIAYHSSNNGSVQLAFVGTSSMLLSPRGDRASIASGASAGIPILDAASATVAYSIPAGSCYGIDFSSGGDTLFIATGSPSGSSPLPVSLEARDAATGRILASNYIIALPVGPIAWASQVLAEPDRPWIYVLGLTDSAAGPPQRARIFIVDRRTMRLVAHLDVPANQPAGTLNSLQFFLDAKGRRLHILSAAWFHFTLID